MGRLEPARLNRTENFVRFQGPRAECSDGFSRKCAILFRTSHPAAARFRRSFRISVCKTSLLCVNLRRFKKNSLTKSIFLFLQGHPFKVLTPPDRTAVLDIDDRTIDSEPRR